MSHYASIVTRTVGVRNTPRELDPNDEGFVYGGPAASCWDALNQICFQLGVPALKNFQWQVEGSQKDIETEYEGIWYNPAEGLQTVSAVLQVLRHSSHMQLTAHFTERFIEEHLEWIVFDLRAYEMILITAREQKDPFRLSIC